jgi:hypothetical protein
MGSAAIAAWIAHVTFWLLLVYGFAWQELGVRGVAVFLILWLAALYGLPRLFVNGSGLFSPIVAILDIALVFIIFKGDVRLT